MIPSGQIDFLTRLNNLRRISQSPISLFLNNFQEFGDIVAIPIGPITTVLVCSPTGISHILQSEIYKKNTRAYAAFRNLIGDGLISADTELWKRHRAAINPAIKHLNNGLGDTVFRVTRNAIFSSIDDSNLYSDLSELCRHIVLKVTVSLFLGISTDQNETVFLMNSIQGLQYRISRTLRRPYLPHVSLKSYLLYTKFNRHIIELVNQSKESKTTDSVLSWLTAQLSDDHPLLTEAEIISETKTMLIAGYDTTANTLIWAIYSLIRYSDLLKDIVSEIRNNSNLGPYNSKQYPRLYAFLQEVLRVYPAVPVITRVATKDDKIDGYFIKAGTQVTLSPYVTHRHPRYWDQPEQFDPTRFMGDKKYSAPIYFPFSYGARMCIGREIALAELGEILKTLFFYFDLCPRSRIPDESFDPKTITLSLNQPIYGNFRRRSAIDSNDIPN